MSLKRLTPTLLFIVGALVAPKSQAAAFKWLPDNDPCTQSALQEAMTRFPLGQAVSGAYFDWSSSDSGNVKDFKLAVNRGFSSGSGYRQDSVPMLARINRLASAPINALQPEIADQLKAKISGRDIIQVDLNFGNNTWATRVFVITREEAGRCEVEHLNDMLDEYDG